MNRRHFYRSITERNYHPKTQMNDNAAANGVKLALMAMVAVAAMVGIAGALM
jgi:hypothetical protein